MEPKEMEITPSGPRTGARRFFDLTGEHTDIMKAANLPPSMVIVQRINMGLFALFGDRTPGPTGAKIAEEIWLFTDGAPSTPMGSGSPEGADPRSFDRRSDPATNKTVLLGRCGSGCRGSQD